MSKMYDKEYAKIWIENYESQKDTYRVKYIEPFLKKIIEKTPKNCKIIDVGCGWGTVVKFIKKDQEYSGRDIVPEFFKYIRLKNKRKNLDLKYGRLPKEINAPENYYDLAICSLVLHTVGDLQNSIHEIFKRVRKNRKVVIIMYNDSSEDLLRNKTFEKKYFESKSYIRGKLILPSKLKIDVEINIHNEKEIEKELKKYSQFEKNYLGEIFVVYNCTKNQSNRRGCRGD